MMVSEINENGPLFGAYERNPEWESYKRSQFGWLPVEPQAIQPWQPGEIIPVRVRGNQTLESLGRELIALQPRPESNTGVIPNTLSFQEEDIKMGFFDFFSGGLKSKLLNFFKGLASALLEKHGAELIGEAKEFAVEVVGIVAQKNLTGDAKRELAIALLKKRLTDTGRELGDSTINFLIECALQELKLGSDKK